MAFGDSGILDTSNTTPGGTGVLSRPAPKDRIKQNPKQRNRGTSDRPVPTPRASVLSIPEWTRPRSYNVMHTVDTMLSQTRFAAASKFYDTRGSAFRFKPTEIAGMIDKGILAYGKVGDTGYRTPTVGVDVRALDQFLRDNYKSVGGGFQRTKDARTKGLALSDTFKQVAAGSTTNFNAGIRYLNPSQPAALLEDTPKKSVPGGEEYDYKKMSEQYLKDEDTYATLQSKILSKIAENGGSALLNQISTNGATPESIAALKEYMYSPDGKYGKAQMRWIDETFLGGAGKEAIAQATRKAADMDQRKYLYEERIKEQAALEKERQKDIETANVLYFNTDPAKGAIIPKTSWLNNAMAMGLRDHIVTGKQIGRAHV